MIRNEVGQFFKHVEAHSLQCRRFWNLDNSVKFHLIIVKFAAGQDDNRQSHEVSTFYRNRKSTESVSKIITEILAHCTGDCGLGFFKSASAWNAVPQLFPNLDTVSLLLISSIHFSTTEPKHPLLSLSQRISVIKLAFFSNSSSPLMETASKRAL